jgi:hypothetical protein
MSNIFKVLAIVIYSSSGVLGMILSIPIIYRIGGMFLLIISFLLFPVTLLLAPWYDVIFNHRWLLLALTYLPWPICGGLLAIANALEKKT